MENTMSKRNVAILEVKPYFITADMETFSADAGVNTGAKLAEPIPGWERVHPVPVPFRVLL